MNQPRQENPPLPDRWWLVALVSAMVAVVAAIAILHLPQYWSWLMLLALAVFVFTYRLHPALWYRRRAEAAFAVAVVTTITPGLEAFVRWGPGTLARLVVDSGWPATVFPWLARLSQSPTLGRGHITIQWRTAIPSTNDRCGRFHNCPKGRSDYPPGSGEPCGNTSLPGIACPSDTQNSL